MPVEVIAPPTVSNSVLSIPAVPSPPAVPLSPAEAPAQGAIASPTLIDVVIGVDIRLRIRAGAEPALAAAVAKALRG